MINNNKEIRPAALPNHSLQSSFFLPNMKKPTAISLPVYIRFRIKP